MLRLVFEPVLALVPEMHRHSEVECCEGLQQCVYLWFCIGSLLPGLCHSYMSSLLWGMNEMGCSVCGNPGWEEAPEYLIRVTCPICFSVSQIQGDHLTLNCKRLVGMPPTGSSVTVF